jgi:FecR protein
VPKPSLSAKWIGLVGIVCTILLDGCAGTALTIGPLTLVGSQRPTGILLYADRGVTIMRTGSGPVGYESGMEVLAGDTIETAGGQAVLDYDDGSVVVLNRATRIRLGSIWLFLGELFARVKSIASRGGGTVVTDELSASVEGTEYGVRRDLVGANTAPGRVQVYVRQGRVSCAPSGGASWSPITVAANQAFEVEGYRAAVAPRAVDARSLSRWADEAEQRLWKPRVPTIGTIISVPLSPQRPRPPRHRE